MSRIFKQFIYGFGFSALFFLLIASFYFLFLRPAPINETQSQKNIRDLSPLDNGGASFFSGIENGVGKTIVVAHVKNYNIDYGSDNFFYTFNIYGLSGENIGSLSGSSFIYNADEKYILKVADIAPSKVGSIDFNFGETSWKSKDEFKKPKLTIINQAVQIAADSNQIEAIGTIDNESGSLLAKVFLTGFLKNDYGIKIGASKTELENLGPFSSRQFKIIFPSNISTSSINIDKAEIYVDGKQQ